MSVLYWDKPERIMSIERWRELGFDGGPRGAYVPNMSDEDKLRWKAKVVRSTKHPQLGDRVEIRKSTANGTQILVVVGLNGAEGPHPWGRPGEDRNVKISMNGPAFLHFTEVADLANAVEEARAVLVQRERGKD